MNLSHPKELKVYFYISNLRHYNLMIYKLIIKISIKITVSIKVLLFYTKFSEE